MDANRASLEYRPGLAYEKRGHYPWSWKTFPWEGMTSRKTRSVKQAFLQPLLLPHSLPLSHLTRTPKTHRENGTRRKQHPHPESRHRRKEKWRQADVQYQGIRFSSVSFIYLLLDWLFCKQKWPFYTWKTHLSLFQCANKFFSVCIIFRK